MKIFTIICYMMLFLYLGYLSYKDIKKHQLEYIETGMLFPVSVACCVCNVLNASNKGEVILEAIIGAVFMFVLMLAFALIKKNGVSAFGGADIWVIAILAITLGLTNSLISMIVTCVAFILYILINKLLKKEKKDKIAFVPFISIGTVITLILCWI